MIHTTRPLFATFIAILVVAGCDPGTRDGGMDAALDAEASPPTDAGNDATADSFTPPAYTLAEGCDPLVPSHCGLPFPSDTWLVTDPSARHGRRLAFGARTIPRARDGTQTPVSTFANSDGFSPGSYLLTHMPGATTTGLADANHIEASLLPASPTVLIEAATGRLVAHFAELDRQSNSNAARAFMIRPAARLADDTRYIVAIRRVLDANGTPLPPSEAFRALRDNVAYPSDPSIEARRPHYEQMFATLATASVVRSELQLVWDFTTASRENNTRAMLAMRDTALAALGPDGPAYTIDSVRTNVNANIAVRIEGQMTVPLYLDMPGPGGRMHFGPDGLPIQNGTTTYPFLVEVPVSATMGTPAPMIQAGHGLFLDRYFIDNDQFQSMANRLGYVLFALDWLGMSHPDPPAIASAIATGDISNFLTVPDRGRQAFLNFMLATRMMTGAFGREPSLQFHGASAIDPTRRYYVGGSLGGIYGTSFMALTPDILRGVLAVPGQAFSLMLPRSVLYGQFAVVLNGVTRDAIDAMLILQYAQMLWDSAEPDGYSPYVTSNPLPGTPAHQVFMLAALGDHQVSNVATHNLARTLGLGLLMPSVRPVFGLDPVAGPTMRSVLIEQDWGLPPIPVVDLPMTDGTDPHGHILDPMSAQQMMDQFLRTGTVQNACGGPCTPG